MSEPGAPYDFERFPDVPVPPNLDEEEQREVMLRAASNRGGLASGEDLIALPTGTIPPSAGWTREGTIFASSGRKYEIYTRKFSAPPKESNQQHSNPAGADHTADTAPPGQASLEDIDKHFSDTASPAGTQASCPAAFVKGFAKGAVVGYAMGFVLTALGPAGAAIGAGLLLYSLYQTVTSWEKIKAMSSQEKAELAGEILGGIVGAGLGARSAMRFRSKLAKPPRSKADINHRQKIHKPGTNEYKMRTNSPKGKPTAWKDPARADDLTIEAYEKGQVTQKYPDGSPKEVRWSAGEPVGDNGETQITVKLDKDGKLHGFPSGKKGP